MTLVLITSQNLIILSFLSLVANTFSPQYPTTNVYKQLQAFNNLIILLTHKYIKMLLYIQTNCNIF